jgi:hypothetical protein
VTQPANTVAGNSLNGIVVKAADRFGNAIPSSLMTVGLAAPASTTLLKGPRSAVTNSTGQTTFAGLAVSRVGGYTLSATAAGRTAFSSPFTISAGPAARLSFATSPADASAGSTLSSVTVQVYDIAGNISTQAGVLVTVNLTGGTLSSGTTQVPTNASGQAIFNTLVENKSGTYTLTATGAGTALSKSFKVLPGLATALSFVTQPKNVAAGNSLGAVTVQAVDTFGNAAPGTLVSIAITAGGSISTGTTLISTNGAGQVTFSNLTVHTTGTYTLTASALGVGTSPVSNAFAITPAAGILSFVVQPTGTTAGAAIGSSTVQIADRYGNAVVGATVNIGLTPGTLSTGSPPQTTNGSGQATFAGLTENKAGTYRLVASSAGVTSVNSTTFVIIAAAPAQMTFIAQPANTSAGATIKTLTVQIQDQYGNPANQAGIGVTIATTSGPPLTTGTTSVNTNSLGQAVFGNLTETAPGTYSLTASAILSGNPESATSNTFTIVAASAFTISFTAQPTSTTAGTSLGPVAVQVLDIFGNPVIGKLVVMKPSATSLLGQTTIATDATGTATFSTLAIGRIGNYTLTASSGGLTTQSTTFTISVGAAATMSFLTSPSNTTINNTLSLVTIQLYDAFGNLVTTSGIPITLSLTNSGTLNGTTTQLTDGVGESLYGDLSVAQGGTFHLIATGPGLTTTQSKAFFISAGPVGPTT